MLGTSQVKTENVAQNLELTKVCRVNETTQN